MAKRGQKGKYNPDNLLLIGRWVRNGATNDEIANKLGIGKNTFYTWVKKYKEFRDILKRTKEIADTEVEAALYKSAIGYEYEEETITEGTDKTGMPFRTVQKYKKHAPPNLGSIVFWLKNRLRDIWRDRVPDDVKIDTGSIKELVNALNESQGDIKDDESGKGEK